MSRSTETLRQLQLMLCRELEYAAAEIGELNSIIARIASSEHINQTALLGEVVYQRAYHPGQGPSESAQVFQACIRFPGGIGLVAWDMEMYLERRDHCEPPIGDALIRFVPFDECSATAQCCLLSQVHPLMAQLSNLIWQG